MGAFIRSVYGRRAVSCHGASLFKGIILLGVMMQVSNAFQRVHGGFALFLHNWTTINELRSIYRRLNEFEANLRRYEKQI